MNQRAVFTCIVLILLAAFSASQALAQGAAPTTPQTDLGAGFTYQGQLKNSSGAPLNSTCSFQFTLWDTLSGGTQIGGVSAVNGISVSGGYFTAQVNATGEFGVSAFNGAARWLQVTVQCTGDAQFTALAPRQELAAAPYALSLRPGAAVTGSGAANGPALTVENTDISDNSSAILGQSHSIFGAGVAGYASSTGFGNASGVWGQSDTVNGIGVSGYVSATNGSTYGVYGASISPFGYGVYGNAYATTGITYGVAGVSISPEGFGVYGLAANNSGQNNGVYGESRSTAGYGVFGKATATNGKTYGVYGESAATAGYGVDGYASASSGFTRGVSGGSASTDGRGVLGYASAPSGTTYGVWGLSASTDGFGVYGYTSATSGITHAVWGQSDSTDGRGVLGYASAPSGTTYGVVGWVQSPDGYAGRFDGNVMITGALTKSAGSFKIDNPLDPTNQYLSHSFVESPDMKNIYDGQVYLDASGQAWVELPAWFQALNGGAEFASDYRYQLTPIGSAMPGLYISQKVQSNRFQIAGGAPGQEVSWQVTGIRHDPYAEAHRIQVEQAKPAAEQGTYLFPELYGQPVNLGLNYQNNAAQSNPQPEVSQP